MSTSIAGILELSLIFGALLGFLSWELFSLHKDSRRDKSEPKD